MTMQPPDEGPKEEEMICPNCGSTDVQVNEENTYKVAPMGTLMHEYHCASCNAKFFPAMENIEVDNQGKLIEKWSRKVDQELWQERMRQRVNKPKKFYIRIEK